MSPYSSKVTGPMTPSYLIGLPSLMSCSALANSSLPAWIDRAVGVEHLADRVLDRRRIRLAGLRDGEADDGAGVIGAVGGRVGRIDAGELLVVRR